MTKSYQSNFTLGTLTLSDNVFYAPLSGHTDLPFRRICNIYRPGLYFCEMVKMDALIRNHSSTIDLLSYDENMHPIGAQIFGSNPKYARQAAKMIEDFGFDLIDLNCGCPVPKVTRDGSGSGLLKTPEKIGEILSEMIAAVKIPVTVKIRIGWDDDHLVATKILEMAEAAGACAITIHGRTTVAGYRGTADWSQIKACADIAKTIKVIGNGDLFDHQKVEEIFDATGCDGVMIGRGMLSQPYLAEDIRKHFLGKEVTPKTLAEIFELLLAHFHSLVHCFSDHRTVFHMKRVACWYLKGYRGMRKVRTDIMGCQSVSEVMDLIHSFMGSLEQFEGISLQKTFSTLEDVSNE